MDRRQFSATVAALMAAPCFGRQPEPLYGFKRLQQECAARGCTAYVDVDYRAMECTLLLVVGVEGGIDATHVMTLRESLDEEYAIDKAIDALAEILCRQLAIYGSSMYRMVSPEKSWRTPITR